MTTRIAINGFGRIGRNILRATINVNEFEIVAVNDITDAKTLAHLLKYDSVFGVFDAEIEVRENAIAVNGKEIRITAERDPSQLQWKELGIDLRWCGVPLQLNRKVYQ